MRSCGESFAGNRICVVDDPCPNCQRAMGVHPEQKRERQTAEDEKELELLRGWSKRALNALKRALKEDPENSKLRKLVFDYSLIYATRVTLGHHRTYIPPGTYIFNFHTKEPVERVPTRKARRENRR